MTRSIFDSKAQVLVNPVNCVGVAGAGLALEFKKRFPANFEAYRQAKILPGKVFMVKEEEVYIANFPTKRHWMQKSRLADIEFGLRDLKIAMQQLHIESVAIPALGCGLGGLSWEDVKPLILQELGEEFLLDLYPPIFHVNRV